MHCQLANVGDGVQATIKPSDSRDRSAPRLGAGPTIEAAIGNAIARPGIRFHTAGDETFAEIAAFRERAVNVMLKGDEMVTLGFR